MAESPSVNDPMYQGVSYAACVAGAASSGTLKIGNITTPVVRPVNVQFGFFPPPNSAPGGDNTADVLSPPPAVLPPPAGVSAMLVTKPDLIPESLLTALGCPGTAPVVKNLCVEAKNFGGKYLDVYGLAQSAGPLTNFGLSWTQRLKLKLINPLLGNNCYIGTDQNSACAAMPRLGCSGTYGHGHSTLRYRRSGNGGECRDGHSPANRSRQ